MAVERRKTITACAPAKINLWLQVLGVRRDGYHDLRTIFQSLALHDTLTLRAARGPFRLTCDDPDCPADETNLVWRAADALWAASGRGGAARGVAVHLAKRIPTAAGLGGGSSDAAAALRALAILWRVDAARVRAAARSLGADVPYFLEGGTVLGLDRGDALFSLVDFPVAWVALVVPPFGVSAKEAYAWWDRDRPRRVTGSGVGDRPDPVNDLQGAVVERHPEIGRLVRRMARLGADLAAMSGSGSAVFGLFARRADAERAARALSARGGRAFVTRTLTRAAYRRLAGIAAHRIHLPFAPRGFGHI